jgi:hypothetical protein
MVKFSPTATKTNLLTALIAKKLQLNQTEYLDFEPARACAITSLSLTVLNVRLKSKSTYDLKSIFYCSAPKMSAK